VLSHEAEREDGPSQHFCEPCAVTNPLGEELGVVQIPKKHLVLRQYVQRITEIPTEEIDATGGVLPGFRQPVQDLQRLLEEHNSLAICGPRPGVSSCLPQVRHGLLPCLSSHGMVCEPLRLLAKAIRVVPLDGSENRGMELATTILEKPSVSDLVGQRVLERVFQVRKETRLVEELGGLQMGEPPTQVFLGSLGNGEEEGEWHVFSHDRGGLEQLLVPRIQPVDTGGQDGLYCRRNVDRVERPGESILPALSYQDVGFQERSHAFLKEQWISPGPGEEKRLERLKRGIRPEQRQEQLVAALARKCVQTELRVIGLATPPMLVVRPVTHEQQDPCGGDAFDQGAQQRLGLLVDPVEILDDHEEWLHPALAEQQTLDGVKRPPAALRCVERRPLGILDGHIEERQQGGQLRLQGPVEREKFARDLLADLPLALPVVQLEVNRAGFPGDSVT
jgi:hypothetical protein